MAIADQLRARVLAAACLAVTALPSVAVAAPGPPLQEPAGALMDALVCHGPLAGSPGAPALLVHGTAVTADQNWEPTYRPELQRRGHGVCTVQIPMFAFGDVQRNVEYVVHAIREVHRRSGRRIAILGNSQGAFLPFYALRVWPDLAAMVDDFIGIAGAYERGSEAIAADCASDDGCVAAFTQLSAGSDFLRRLVRHPVPAEPSFSAIGTLADTVVTPQPQANVMPRGRSVQIQDLCPGRAMPGGNDHVFLVGDAVAHALILDALANAGPVDPARVTAPPCGETFFAGVDSTAFATKTVPGFLTNGSGETTKTEPPDRCYLEPTCRDVDARGRMLSSVRVRRPRSPQLVMRAVQAGTVRVVVRRRTARRAFRRVVRRVAPGSTTVALCRKRRACRARDLVIRVDTKPDAFTAFGTERRLR